MNKKITTLVIIGIALLIGVLLLINRSTHFFGYADDSQSALIRSVSLNQSSNAASGSGQGGASGSGQGDSGSGVDSGTILGKPTLTSIKVTSILQLKTMFAKMSFDNSVYKDSFYKIVKKSIDDKGYSDIYFDKIYDSNTNIMVQYPSCASVVSVQKLSSIPSYATTPSDTPDLDKSKGVCGPLTAGHSMNFRLKTQLPAGFPGISEKGKLPNHPDIVYEAWKTDYLQRLAAGLVDPASGGTLDSSEIKFYEKFYGENNLDMQVFEFKIPIDKDAFDNVFKLFNDEEADCSFHPERHVSHITKIWYSWEDNSINIETTNTAYQGDEAKGKWKNIPIDPGTITYKFKTSLDGKTVEVSVKSDIKGVNPPSKKKNDKIMEESHIKQLKRADGSIGFRIVCIKPKK